MRPNACIIEEYDEHKHTHTLVRCMRVVATGSLLFFYVYVNIYSSVQV